MRSLSASDLRRDAEEDKVCLPSTAATKERATENKTRKQQRRQFNHTAVLSALLIERSPDLCMLQRERQHVECVQNSERTREVLTSHAHNCSQPTSERRAASRIIAGREVGLDFGRRPPAFDLRPSASGLRPPALAFGLRPPVLRQAYAGRVAVANTR